MRRGDNETLLAAIPSPATGFCPTCSGRLAWSTMFVMALSSCGEPRCLVLLAAGRFQRPLVIVLPPMSGTLDQAVRF